VQWTRVSSHRSPARALILVDLGVVLIWVWLASSYEKRAILHRDAIEVAGWFYSRKLNFAEIRGRRGSGGSRGAFGYAYIFVPLDRRKRQLSLPPSLRTDQIFRDWIRTIPKIQG